MEHARRGAVAISPRQLLYKSPLAGRLRRALAGSLMTAIFGQGVLVFSGIIVARSLGPEDRGHFAFVVLIAVVVSQVALLGVPQAVTYFVARGRPAARSLVRTVLPLAAAQTVAILLVHALVLVALMRGERHDVRLAAALTLAAGPVLVAHLIGLAVLQGQGRFLPFNLLRVLPATCHTIAVLVLFFAGEARLMPIATAWVLSYACAAVATLMVVIAGLPRSAADAPTATRSEIVRFGAKGFLGSVSPVETFRLDQAVIGLFLSPAALGLYVVALAFTNLPRFVAQSIGVVAYPHIAAESDAGAARSAAWKFFWFTLAAAALVVAPLFAGAGVLVPLFFGDTFSDAVTATRILLVASLFFSGRRILSDVSRGLGMPHLGSVGEVVSWLALVPAMALFTPRWGVDGVAAALAVSSAVSILAIAGPLAFTHGRTTLYRPPSPSAQRP